MSESEIKSLEQAGEEDPEPYFSFTRVEKFCIVALVSFAACFSTLSSFIYYPALEHPSEDVSVSVDDINLTITTYMAAATVAPTLVGDAADILGRRPVYILTLSLYIGADVAIPATRPFHALLGTFSIAYGVITDIASPGERGSFASAVSFAITIAPSIGPILGGCLTYARNWTWIFWFLAIAAGTCLVTMTAFLPETTRSIVGNGSIPPPKLLQLPFGTFMRHWHKDDAPISRPRRVPNPFKSLLILTYKDNATVILACGLLYAVYTSLNASLSVLCIEIYNRSQWQAGLIYLSLARTKRELDTNKASGDDLENFPIEKARLSVMWKVPMAVTVASVISVGWVLHYQKHIAIVLVIQFVAGLVMQLDFSIYNTLLVDKNHRNPSAASASSNIVRCTLGAVIVAFLQDCIKSLGTGGTFTLMGGLCGITSWRQNRRSSPFA
ncbi:multidrug resistance protein [Xylaria venustula]|nr:multidrug resistance protein [Xylaria venustula]